MVAGVLRLNSSLELTEELEAVLQRASRSIVQVRNGHAGVGAGILWSADGWILTNNHVLGQPVGELTVILPDGNAFPARLLGRDPEVDLALVKIEGSNLPQAEIADSSKLVVGQLVFAIGHPWGQPGYVTAGILSALGQVATRGGAKIPILRTDLALAPGNSGGPLLNAAGEVIGINTMIVGGDQGLAIPSQVTIEFVSRISRENGPSYGNHRGAAL
ncbi:MAG TPA: trypsin-like peptidase domain-containing protein [Anaerolineaceae bacterium]